MIPQQGGDDLVANYMQAHHLRPAQGYGQEIVMTHKITQVDKIDLKLRNKGGCEYCTPIPTRKWFSILTDGETETIYVSGPRRNVGGWDNGHGPCRDHSDTVRVTGGTYAIQLNHPGSAFTEIVEIFVTKDANLAFIEKILVGEARSRKLRHLPHTPSSGDKWGDFKDLTREERAEVLELAEWVAEGYPFPKSTGVRVLGLVRHVPQWARPGALEARVAFQLNKG